MRAGVPKLNHITWAGARQFCQSIYPMLYWFPPILSWTDMWQKIEILGALLLRQKRRDALQPQAILNVSSSAISQVLPASVGELTRVRLEEQQQPLAAATQRDARPAEHQPITRQPEPISRQSRPASPRHGQVCVEGRYSFETRNC